MDKVLFSPLQYAGGKHWLWKTFMEFFPKDVDEVVSPFFGGGAIELNLAVRGVRVQGYDAFQPLVHFWQCYLRNPEKIITDAAYLYKSQSRNLFVEYHKGRFFQLKDTNTKASIFFILNRMVYGGMGFRSYQLRKNPEKSLSVGVFRTYAAYDIQGVSVQQSDVFETLQRHTDAFLFCDPPYAKQKEGLYGDSKEYHEYFDHERFARELLNREQWILCYNDHEYVRDLYKDAKILSITRKSDGRTKNNEELLILSEDVWQNYLKQPTQLMMFDPMIEN